MFWPMKNDMIWLWLIHRAVVSAKRAFSLIPCRYHWYHNVPKMVSDYQIDSGGAKWCLFHQPDLCCPEPYMARSWHRTRWTVAMSCPEIWSAPCSSCGWSQIFMRAIAGFSSFPALLHWNHGLAIQSLTFAILDAPVTVENFMYDISCAHQHLKAKCIQRIQIIEMDKMVSWLILKCKPTFSSTHSKRATPKLWTILDLQGQSQILCILVETWDWQYVSNPTYRKRNRSCRRHQLVLLSAVETCWNHILNMFEPESSWNSHKTHGGGFSPHDFSLFAMSCFFRIPPKEIQHGFSLAKNCQTFFRDPSRPIHLAFKWPLLRLGMTTENHQQLWRWFARTNDQIRESLDPWDPSGVAMGSHGETSILGWFFCEICEIALL